MLFGRSVSFLSGRFHAKQKRDEFLVYWNEKRKLKGYIPLHRLESATRLPKSSVMELLHPGSYDTRKVRISLRISGNYGLKPLTWRRNGCRVSRVLLRWRTTVLGPLIEALLAGTEYTTNDLILFQSPVYVSGAGRGLRRLVCFSSARPSSVFDLSLPSVYVLTADVEGCHFVHLQR